MVKVWRKWSKGDIDYLIKMMNTPGWIISYDSIGKILGRSWYSVQCKARRLGLCKEHNRKETKDE